MACSGREGDLDEPFGRSRAAPSPSWRRSLHSNTVGHCSAWFHLSEGETKKRCTVDALDDDDLHWLAPAVGEEKAAAELKRIDGSTWRRPDRGRSRSPGSQQPDVRTGGRRRSFLISVPHVGAHLSQVPEADRFALPSCPSTLAHVVAATEGTISMTEGWSVQLSGGSRDGGGCCPAAPCSTTMMRSRRRALWFQAVPLAEPIQPFDASWSRLCSWV